MKTELRARPHDVILGAVVFEVWYGGQFIAVVTGADGPGVRIVSKYVADNAKSDIANITTGSLEILEGVGIITVPIATEEQLRKAMQKVERLQRLYKQAEGN